MGKAQKTTKAYIGIGSNLGDRHAHCTAAVEEIEGIPGSSVVQRSDWFWSEPVGVEGQEWYLNGVVAVETAVSPRELLDHLLAIEKKMGRVRKVRWEARVLDLDLLLFGDEVIQEEGLTVPHPLMHQRRFVMVPLVQIAPNLRHPASQKTVSELLGSLPEAGQVLVPWRPDECCA